MSDAELTLAIGMRVFGAVSLLALPFVFVPRSWMNAIHSRMLRMGPLPREPVVGYLARSTSAFYAILGGLMLLMSGDPERYGPAIGFLLGVIVVFGLVLLWVDISERMPVWWILGEGPSIVLIAGVLLALWWQLP